MTLAALLDTMAAFGVASGVARSSLVYATVSALHVLGIGLLIGPLLLVDLRLMGLLRGLEPAATHLLRRAGAAGVLLAMTTGLLLASAKPQEYATNPAFQAKLVLIGAALANALLFEARLRRDGEHVFTGTGARIAGFASLALWLGALFLGRWIAFV